MNCAKVVKLSRHVQQNYLTIKQDHVHAQIALLKLRVMILVHYMMIMLITREPQTMINTEGICKGCVCDDGKVTCDIRTNYIITAGFNYEWIIEYAAKQAKICPCQMCLVKGICIDLCEDYEEFHNESMKHIARLNKELNDD